MNQAERNVIAIGAGVRGPEILHLPTPLLAQTIRHCLSSYPHEACGLLIGRRSATGIYVRRSVLCTNQLPPTERSSGFSIDPLELLKNEDAAAQDNEQLVGVYHSHCDTTASPSAVDVAAAQSWPQLLWLIVATGQGRVSGYSAWWPDGSGLSRLPMTQPPAPPVLLSAGP